VQPRRASGEGLPATAPARRGVRPRRAHVPARLGPQTPAVRAESAPSLRPRLPAPLLPWLGSEGGSSFDREDGCWLPAGLDSDTFPIFADRSLVRRALPFCCHVSRRAGLGRTGGCGSAGRGMPRDSEAGVGSELRGFLLVRVGSGQRASRARIWRGRASGRCALLAAGMRSEQAGRCLAGAGCPGKRPPTTRGVSFHLEKDSRSLRL
jgi:hypothetical protein